MSRDIYSPHRRRSSLSGLALIIIIVPLVILLIGAVFFVFSQFNSVKNKEDNSTKYFAVKSGDGIRDIAKKLEEQSLITNKDYFSLYVSFKGGSDSIEADLYKLSSSQSMKEIASVLLAGESTRDNEIVIIEGWTVDQIASEFATFKKDFAKSDRSEDELKNGFIAETSKVSDYDYEFLKDLPKGVTLEGFLFPDTYELYQDAQPSDLIDKMLTNFNSKLDDDLKKSIEKREEDLFEVITLASIVQKEVKTEEEMKGVAGVYYNRLYIGRELESDVTVNYVTKKNTPQPSFEDTKVNSPYNTYKYEGLPPGPVGNPGLTAIRATTYPAKHDYYYFLTRLDTGEAIFSTRGYEHEAKKEKYLK